VFQARVSSLLKKGVHLSGLSRWWENHITPWPRAIFYHYVGNEAPSFVTDIAVGRDIFLQHVSVLRRHYRFLTWPEYKDALASPKDAKRCLLLTFDDGFASTWSTMNDLATEEGIPSVFFVNTRVFDNAYAPWTIQYYFLREQANGRFLDPLWKSISNGAAMSTAATRRRCHARFSLRNVVEPIEEGLAKFGLTPAELAQRYRLYVDAADVRKRNHLVAIGNHSHSHYILSKLSDEELEHDLRASHEFLLQLLGADPDCFAYPFGVPGEHFNERSLSALRSIGRYPYILSAIDTIAGPSDRNNIGRACFDKLKPGEVVGATAKITPRALKQWIFGRALGQ
jgi:peptidoglycan/xylan/chitin deacetylase (PgdA/CDA1 family)